MADKRWIVATATEITMVDSDAPPDGVHIVFTSVVRSDGIRDIFALTKDAPSDFFKAEEYADGRVSIKDQDDTIVVAYSAVGWQRLERSELETHAEDAIS